MNETVTRHFTVSQADATLPLVRRIVRDLLSLHPRWREAVTTYEAEQARASSGPELEPARAARIEAGRLAGEIEACMEELEMVGCDFKGFESGLIDFPAFTGGRDVLLCWQYDEPRVSHWHELDAGFAGRQEIGALQFEDHDS